MSARHLLLSFITQRVHSVSLTARVEKETLMLNFVEIVQTLDDLYYELDPYGYYDDVKSREEGLIRIRNLIRDPVSASKCLQDILDAESEGMLTTIRNYDELKEALSAFVARPGMAHELDTYVRRSVS